MFRLIGGPSRCGKSTLADRVSRTHEGQHVSVDYLRYSFATVGSAPVKEALQLAPDHTLYTPTEWIQQLRCRDAIVWEGVRTYLDVAAPNGDDVLMEGCLWPDYVSELEYDYRAVFLVDTSPDLANRLITAAADPNTHNNWQRNKSPEWIKSWAQHNIVRSEYYKELCQQYNQPVFDIADSTIQQAQDAATEFLFA